MILAHLEFNRNDETKQTCDCDSDTNIAKDQSFYTTEQTGDMPHWIDEQKNAAIQETNANQCQFQFKRVQGVENAG